MTKKAKPATTAPPKEARVGHYMIYLGVRPQGLGREKKKVHAWIRLPAKDAKITGISESTFVKPLQKGATPGAIYLMQGNADGSSMFINSGAYQGRYEDTEAVARWLVDHHSSQREFELASKASAELRKRFDLELLEPYGAAYRSAGPVRRGLIIAMVIHAITKGAY